MKYLYKMFSYVINPPQIKFPLKLKVLMIIPKIIIQKLIAILIIIQNIIKINMIIIPVKTINIIEVVVLNLQA